MRLCVCPRAHVCLFRVQVFEMYCADTGDKVKLLVLLSGEDDANLARFVFSFAKTHSYIHANTSVCDCD